MFAQEWSQIMANGAYQDNAEAYFGKLSSSQQTQLKNHWQAVAEAARKQIIFRRIPEHKQGELAETPDPDRGRVPINIKLTFAFFYGMSLIDQAGLIVHELSHWAFNTDDHVECMCNLDDPTDAMKLAGANSNQALDNADNYRLQMLGNPQVQKAIANEKLQLADPAVIVPLYP
jgi:hypothetical protein